MDTQQDENIPKRKERKRTKKGGRAKNPVLRCIKRIRMSEIITHAYHFAKCLNRFAVDRQSVNFSSKEDVRKALISAVIFFTFLFVNIYIILTPHVPYMFYYYDRLMRVLALSKVYNEETNAITFEKLLTVPIFWDYMEHCVLKFFHGSTQNITEQNFDDENILSSGENLIGNVFLMENMVLGPPRLRQKRVLNKTCSVPTEFARYFDSCYAPYSDKVQMKSRLFQRTTFQSAKKTITLSITGKVATYSGGGYIQELTWDKETNLQIIRNLRDKNWIDRATRMVVFELTTYNHNLKIFGDIRLLIELMPTGFLVTTPLIGTIKELSVFESPSTPQLMCCFILYILLIYYVLKSLTQIFFRGFRKYFQSTQNRIELGIIICHIIILAYNSWHWYFTFFLVKIFTRSKMHITLDRLKYYYDWYINLLGLLCVLLMLEVFQFLQFNITVKKFLMTLKAIQLELLGFLLMFLIAFLAYAQIGILLFSNVHYGFQSFLFSIMSLNSMVLRNFDFSPLSMDYPIMGAIYLISFIFIIFCILLNMFLAFIVATYAVITAEVGNTESFLIVYLKDLMYYVFKFVKSCGRPPKNLKIKEHTHKEEMIDIWDERQEEELPEKERKVRQQMREFHRIRRRTVLLEMFLNLLITNMDDVLKAAQNTLKKTSFKKAVFRYTQKLGKESLNQLGRTTKRV